MYSKFRELYLLLSSWGLLCPLVLFAIGSIKSSSLSLVAISSSHPSLMSLLLMPVKAGIDPYDFMLIVDDDVFSFLLISSFPFIRIKLLVPMFHFCAPPRSFLDIFTLLVGVAFSLLLSLLIVVSCWFLYWLLSPFRRFW